MSRVHFDDHAIRRRRGAIDGVPTSVVKSFEEIAVPIKVIIKKALKIALGLALGGVPLNRAGAVLLHDGESD